MAIVVTGFGPFGNFKTNASWEGVRGLPEIWEDKDHPVIVEEIPVQYQFVQEHVPTKWLAEEPLFVVHVGVHGGANKVILEKQAHNDGYTRGDIDQTCPPDSICVSCGPVLLKSVFDLDKVATEVNKNNVGVSVGLSEDPGRYLCDFVYYKSLHGMSGKSLFIHVPDLGKPYSAKQLTQAIAAIIKNILEQVHCKQGLTEAQN